MPKVSKTQATFNAGQVSKSVYGRVDSERYDAGLAVCLNYLPTNQGPIIRRPGTKFISNVKDPSTLPVLVPFQFSANQNYILEFGDKYVRFYQNGAQITANSTYFQVSGLYGFPVGSALVTPMFSLNGVRSSYTTGVGESLVASSVVAAGSTIELQTDYSGADLPGLRWTQKADTLYLTHPLYPPKKLQRYSTYTWDIKDVDTQDGPYLPLNSYKSIADCANVTWSIGNGVTNPQISTLPAFTIYKVNQAGNGNAVLILNTSAQNFYNVGDKVCVNGANGATYINNVIDGSMIITNSSPSQAYWLVESITPPGSLGIVCPYNSGAGFALTTSAAVVQPAVFQLTAYGSSYIWADLQKNDNPLAAGSNHQNNAGAYRPIGLIMGGYRYWGTIRQVLSAATANLVMAPGNNLPTAGSSVPFWQMGVYNQINGFPAVCGFHQDRLTLAGAPGYPQQFDMSMTGTYESFSASGSNLQVNANNAIQFGLNSGDLNQIRWLKSSSLGLLAGTNSGEWAIAPNSQNPALTPTNVSATMTSYYGSYDAEAIQVANATLYIQRAQRKVRELIYFWQVGNFRSNNMTELAEFITLPSISQIINQKEVHPTIWGRLSNGLLVSMCYKRDDVTQQSLVGWASHQLGGKSDAAGSAPIVSNMSVIPSTDGSYDEVWMVVKRFINGSNAVTIESLSKSFDDSMAQEYAYHLDCGSTYNSSIVISNISNATLATITSNNHGLSNSTVVRFYNCVGMNNTITDVNGNSTITNAMNEKTFVVQSSQTNSFMVSDFNGNFLNTNSSSAYVGSCVVKALVSSIGGLSWLAGETVSVLADGSMQSNTTVSQAGVLGLNPPAAVVSIGYSYNSDAQMLRTKDGSPQGSSIGSNRRVNRVAFMLHNVGDFSYGPSFTQLTPIVFEQADVQQADVMTPMFDGITRHSIESGNDQFNDAVCWRQGGGLPGMIQAVTRFLEENDV